MRGNDMSPPRRPIASVLDWAYINGCYGLIAGFPVQIRLVKTTIQEHRIVVGMAWRGATIAATDDAQPKRPSRTAPWPKIEAQYSKLNVEHNVSLSPMCTYLIDLMSLSFTGCVCMSHAQARRAIPLTHGPTLACFSAC